MGDPSDRNEIRLTYDRIADHFADTRQHAWDEVLTFIEDCPTGEFGIDIGAANGRHIPALTQICTDVIALDISRRLLERGRIENPSDDVWWVQGDAMTLPLNCDVIDVAIAIATYHHLPSRSDRIAGYDELARILGPAGVAFISVWSVTHDRFDESKPTDKLVPWTLPSGETIDRYYHLYDQPSFERDLQDSQLSVLDRYEANGNLYARVTSSK